MALLSDFAYARRENLFRLHHVESFADSVRRRNGYLAQRVRQHKLKAGSGFTTKYKLDRLVYFERFEDVHNAIEREKQIKGWLRIKKIALIVSVNPTWQDLSVEWYERHAFQPDEEARQRVSRESSS